jgi:molybdopterin-guanine dinucleotide biosynthesis protein A
VILAGGRGRRLAASKALVTVAGQPMLTHVLRALTASLEEVVVVAKRDTPLPSWSGLEVWREADRPQHPLTGIRHALARAPGRPLLVCAVDLVMVSAELVAELAGVDARGRPAVVARAHGRWQPLLARYEPAAEAALTGAAEDVRLVELVAGLSPVALEVSALDILNVNGPDDLRRAEAALAARDGGPAQPKVKA